MSLILPPSTRSITTPQTFTGLPVAATPRKSPSVRARPLEARRHPIPHSPACSSTFQCMSGNAARIARKISFRPSESPVPGRGTGLAPPCPPRSVVTCGVDPASVQDFLNEAADDAAVAVHRLMPCLPFSNLAPGTLPDAVKSMHTTQTRNGSSHIYFLLPSRGVLAGRADALADDTGWATRQPPA